MKRRSFLSRLGKGTVGAAILQSINPVRASSKQGVLTGCSEFPDNLTVSTSPEDQCDPWIELDMNNLAWNISETRKHIGNRPILAVVKCNAYGYGAAW